MSYGLHVIRRSANFQVLLLSLSSYDMHVSSSSYGRQTFKYFCFPCRLMHMYHDPTHIAHSGVKQKRHMQMAIHVSRTFV